MKKTLLTLTMLTLVAFNFSNNAMQRQRHRLGEKKAAVMAAAITLTNVPDAKFKVEQHGKKVTILLRDLTQNNLQALARRIETAVGVKRPLLLSAQIMYTRTNGFKKIYLTFADRKEVTFTQMTRRIRNSLIPAIQAKLVGHQYNALRTAMGNW